MRFLSIAHSDVGIKKETNQDSVLVKEASTDCGKVMISAICDGMGGLAKGEVASAALVRTFSRWFEEEFPFLIYETNGKIHKLDYNILQRSLNQLIDQVNLKIAAYGEGYHSPCGTTLAALLLINDRYYIANVGDSRVYLLDGGVRLLTKDQTFVQREMDEGRMTKEEAKKTTIYYVTDEIQQSQYINMFRNQGQDAVILSHNIDSPFITQLEQKNPTIRFQRIDADVTENVKEEVAEEDKEAFKATADSLIGIFRKELGNDKLDVKIEKLKDDKVASMITLSEQSRRMQEMMKMYGMGNMGGMDMGGDSTLILNANHPLVQFVVDHKEHENVSIICKQLYDLAMLAHKPLNPEEMTAFVQRSNEVMMLLTK